MLDWLSGKVPGGFPLLFFIIVSTNLALFYLYKYSRLFSKSSYLQKLNKINGAIISVYVILWLLLRPPTPPKALLFLPFQVNDTVDFAYSEALEEYIGCKDIHGYFIYPWNNFYKTADPDSIGIPLYRLRLVQKMEIETVLSGSIHENKLELFIMQSGIKISEDQSRLKSNSFMETAGLVLTILKSKLKIENPNSLCESLIDDKQIRILSEAKQALAGESYPVHAPQAGEGIAAFDGLRAEIDLKKGIQELKRKKKQNEGRSSSLLVAEDNPYFNELRQILKPYQENNKETSEMNRILGEAYLYEQKYEYAEYFLKKALMQNPCNARVYYLLSFLHSSRIEEMGYKSRIPLLELAVRYDPGFGEAVHDLAEEYYNSGTASPVHSATIKARDILQKYLSFAGKDVEALGLLAKITLHSQRYEEAIALYNRMKQLGADKAEIAYNLGVVYFSMKDDEKAEAYFNQAIEINDYKDAYLYLGMIYKNKNDFDRALYYFRERIKRKEGDDDQYAREAMLGVRIILDKIAEAEKEGKVNSRKNKS